MHRLDTAPYLDEVTRVVLYRPRERFLELAPLHWTATHATLVSAALDTPL